MIILFKYWFILISRFTSNSHLKVNERKVCVFFKRNRRRVKKSKRFLNLKQKVYVMSIGINSTYLCLYKHPFKITCFRFNQNLFYDCFLILVFYKIIII